MRSEQYGDPAFGLKTIQTIALLAYLHEKKGNIGPHLIIAPLSTIHSNWMNEFQTWLPSFGVVIYEGSKDSRQAIRKKYFTDISSFNVLLTTDAFAIKDNIYLRRLKWEYLIVDEAHRLKNPKSKLVHTLNRTDFRVKRRLALTGTPLQNDLNEVWALLNFLMPTIFHCPESFQSWFNAPLVQCGASTSFDVSNEEQLLIIDRLHKVLRPFLLRREKDEVSDEVPEKKEILLLCPLSGVQKLMYRDLDGEGRGQNVSIQLRKICNHPFLFCPLEDAYVDHSVYRTCGKFFMLRNILSKLYRTRHRVLIFSQMVKLLNVLEILLYTNGWRFLRLDGNTSSSDRRKRLADFNAPDSPYFVFILSTKAGGVGVNLQGADTVVLFDTDWNPQNDEQAQSRAHRLGQKRKVLTIRLVSPDTVEERIFNTAHVKLVCDDVVIKSGMYNDIDNDKDIERQESVRRIMEGGTSTSACTSPDAIGDTRAVNALICRSDEEKIIFEEIDNDEECMRLPGLILEEALPPCLLNWKRQARVSVPTAWDVWDSGASLDLRGVERRMRDRWGVIEGQSVRWICDDEMVQYYGKSLSKRDYLIHVADAVLYDLLRIDEYFPFYEIPVNVPLYSTVIKNPIALINIKNHIRQNGLQNEREFERWFEQISHNARLFNGTDHAIFHAALRLQGDASRRLMEKLSVYLDPVDDGGAVSHTQSTSDMHMSEDDSDSEHSS
eukprot:GHVO01017089.1.p1 GENE.GHVO01017089.1~~GHVO01017089.1.p1  ORF type:complete len:720 (+),score=112.14 GHVO01017089.1:41-2200(+)